MKNISKNNKLAILGVSSFLISLIFGQLGLGSLELAALFCFGFSFGGIFFGEKEVK